LKTSDGDQVNYHSSHGTPLSSLDTELEAQHNPKPEWSSHKHLEPAHAGNTNFETSLPDDHPERGWDSKGEWKSYNPTDADKKAQHFMVHIDREANAPGSHYTLGGDSHPQFRQLMRNAGLAHMLPHVVSVGYNDLSIPFKRREHAEAAAHQLQNAGVGIGQDWRHDYGSGESAQVAEYYGFDPLV
jgi:hypothetical protein